MLQSLFKKFKKPFEFGIPYIDVKYFKKINLKIVLQLYLNSIYLNLIEESNVLDSNYT